MRSTKGREISKLITGGSFSIKKQFTSDVVDVKKIKNNEFNLIASSCGTGKTYFCTHKLLSYYSDIKPCEVLFITSRAMIVDQQAQEKGIEKYDHRNIDITRVWNGIEDPQLLLDKGIQIMTYDKLIHILSVCNNEEGETLSKIKIVILDECHTMFSDLFIKDIEAVKVWIRDCLYNEKKIFLGLTATPSILKYNQKEWGVKINQINTTPLIAYKAKQLVCTDFNSIPYIINTNKVVGKTIVMCYSISDCYKLQSKIPNAAILVSKSNTKHYTKQMEEIRSYIVKNESLPEYFTYHYPTREDESKPRLENRKLEVLITTTTLREGFNLKEESGVRNVICCFSDELHVTQFMGRCRFDIDNLVIADTYINTDNINKSSYLVQQRQLFKDYMKFENNVKWFDTISHLVDHDIYEVKRFKLSRNEQTFVDYINYKWLVPIGTEGKKIDKYKIYKEEDKKEIVQAACNSCLFKKSSRPISFLKVIKCMKEELGYDIHDGQQRFDGTTHRYKIVLNKNYN